VSAAVEGALIFIAGLMIIYEAIAQLIHHAPLQKLDWGIYLTAATGVVNFVVGTYAISVGQKNRSLTVEAAGKHLRSDAYSTAGIVIGLVLLIVTGWQWLDSAVAVAFAVMILVTGYKLIRKSMAGIMDEADVALLAQVIKVMQENRKAQWIDLHNLRVILYGDVLHIDAHMTLPWYHQVTDAEREIHAVEELIQTTFGNRVEVFIHVDACMPYQCKICAVPECPHRHHGLQKLLVWTVDNVLADSKHGKETA
jgi:cation diffusion facilitator family transporter